LPFAKSIPRRGGLIGAQFERPFPPAVNLASERRNPPPRDAGPPLRLLVVDDDPNYRTYVAVLTRRLGFWVDVAADGQAAIDRLAQGVYDVVIIDQEMPRLTGLDTITRIRAGEATKGIYAVMLTGRDDVDIKLRALEAGFDDFLTKGSSEPEIVAKLVAARRLATRQRTMDVALRDLYGLVSRDDLTGLFNRRSFISETERMLAEGTPVGVVLLDLDDFKRVNDTYGHLTGDRVLRDVAVALQSSTRAEDVVARFGGDEFVIAIPDLGIETIERIAGRLTAAIEALEWTVAQTFRIGVSNGIASSLLLAKPTLVGLVEAADRDMYKNKWIRKHPDLRPELYEYPADDRDVVERLRDMRG
jgi:diguanylate cyclase (GGDEF)-like protein